MLSMGIEVGEYGELHTVPAMAWAASLVVCGLGDAMLGRWLFLPLFVAVFYGGMIMNRLDYLSDALILARLA